MIKSTVVTASGVVESVSCTLHGVYVTQAGSASTVDVYDNASAASGTKAWSGDGAVVQSNPIGNFAGGGRIMSQGIYVNISGTPGIVVVTYE